MPAAEAANPSQSAIELVPGSWYARAGTYPVKRSRPAFMHNHAASQAPRNTTVRARPASRGLWALLAFLAALLPASAQESLRSSLAIQQAERARQATADIPYNIKIGEARVRFTAGLGLEYNDNINVAESAKLDDIIIRPDMTTELFWPITDQNALQLSLGLGYNKYIDNDNADSLLIRPGSLLSFDVYVDDLRINLHDRFSFFQDPIQQGAISGTNNLNSRYGLAENVIGVGVDWDLNKLVISAGYDRSISFATSPEFEYLDRQSDYFYVRPFVLVAPELTVGAEFTAGLTSYDQSQLNNSDTYSFGPFVDWQLSRFMRLGVRAGYQTYSFDSATNATDTSSYYASLTLDHDLNRFVRYSLGGGHLVSLGVNSDAINLTFVRLTARWQILQQTDINTDLFYEHGEETGSLNPETFNRVGFSVSLGYRLTDKLTAALRYTITDKQSDQPLRGYLQNVIGLNLYYRF
jgi:hypothetical protein